MPAFDKKFSDDQCDAAAHARADQGLTLRRVCELAAAGQLKHRGEPVPAFQISPSYVKDLANALVRRRTGKAVSQLADQPPRDAEEILRRRLVNMVDAEMAAEEKKKDGTRDLERIRQLGRAQHEIARLRPNDPRPASPDSKDANGKRTGGETRGGLAGALLKDHRHSSRGEPEQDATSYAHDGADAARSAQTHEPSSVQTSEQPGSFVREQTEALAP